MFAYLLLYLLLHFNYYSTITLYLQISLLKIIFFSIPIFITMLKNLFKSSETVVKNNHFSILFLAHRYCYAISTCLADLRCVTTIEHVSVFANNIVFENYDGLYTLKLLNWPVMNEWTCHAKMNRTCILLEIWYIWE